jgi:hypothetical protein
MGLVCLSLALSSGCAGFVTAPVVPAFAFVFTDIRSTLDPEVEETKLGSKRGEAEVINILGLVAQGDASVAKAAQAGGITTIRHIDYQLFSVLGVYARFVTVVYGD